MSIEKDVLGIIALGDQQRQLNNANREILDGIENNSALRGRNNELSSSLTDASHRAAQAQDDVEFFLDLLRRPMHEIAEQNRNFARTYEAEKKMLASWMVSQKAFKELAIRFGKEKGLSAAEVIAMGVSLKTDVLKSTNDPDHNTNCSKSAWLRPYAEVLLAEKDA
jgi:hypothetical protein